MVAIVPAVEKKYSRKHKNKVVKQHNDILSEFCRSWIFEREHEIVRKTVTKKRKK